MENGKLIDEHISVCKMLDVKAVEAFSEILNKIFTEGGKVLICGNGGSAADSQHFASELTGRFKKERKALPAIALTTDTSALTSMSNDYGFEHVFRRQVEALGKKGDILILISTSGNSPNQILAAQTAKQMGLNTLALLGKNGGKLKDICDKAIIVHSNNTPRIQEMHIFIIHMICEIIDEKTG